MQEVDQFEISVLATAGPSVIPAEAGIQILVLDPGLRRGDEIIAFDGCSKTQTDPLRCLEQRNVLAW